MFCGYETVNGKGVDVAYLLIHMYNYRQKICVKQRKDGIDIQKEGKMTLKRTGRAAAEV